MRFVPSHTKQSSVAGSCDQSEWRFLRAIRVTYAVLPEPNKDAAKAQLPDAWTRTQFFDDLKRPIPTKAAGCGPHPSIFFHVGAERRVRWYANNVFLFCFVLGLPLSMLPWVCETDSNEDGSFDYDVLMGDRMGNTLTIILTFAVYKTWLASCVSP